jgi:hypothetical protein
MKREFIIYGIILLFVGLAVSPSIYANREFISLGEDNGDMNPFYSELSSKDEINISCQFITYKGAELVNKKISINDYRSLSQLLTSSDDNAITLKLDSLGLLPKSMDIKQVTELIGGNYGKKELSNYLSGNKNIFFNGNITSGENVLCKIQGDAVDSTYRPFWWQNSVFVIGCILWKIGSYIIDFDNFLSSIFPWYQIFGDEFGISFLKSIGYNLGEFLLSLAEMGPYFVLPNIPFKMNGFSIIELDDVFNVGKPNLYTSGLKGDWEIHDQRSILIKMYGFTGIWLTIPDMQQSAGCEFKGFCYYVNATSE